MMGVQFPHYGVPNHHALMNGGNVGHVVDNCVRCGYAGCDVRLTGCGCTFHSRCIQLSSPASLVSCPQCSRPAGGLVLIPMSFREMDEARKTTAALANHGGGAKSSKKRKNLTDTSIPSLDQEKSGEDSDQRTGRWTAAETAYVDQLIAKFESGCLPLVDGIKLNDFLAGMLQCKQSRLTKKMKNAKLSSKCFKRTLGYITDLGDARDFSGLEEAFFHSIHCHEERAEIKFHMHKQWRELFSSYCVSMGQPLDADSWLNSVEEIERRASMAKDAARMVRRKLMMGKAFSLDSKNTDHGVIIDRSENFTITENPVAQGSGPDNDEVLSLLADKSIFHESANGGSSRSGKMRNLSPYLEKVMSYLQRSSIPFEHCDAWVPSFVPTTGADGAASGNPKCRLCFAGFATADQKIPKGSRNPPTAPEEHFNLVAFGEYSQKFSFDIGCGLPGRVYQSGIPTWEQSVHNAPLEHFERCGGAVQCGIKTVVGLPVPSPNVGRIVVVFYSCHDREKDQDLVGRLSEELSRLLPTPRWKLIVDIGQPSVQNSPKGLSPSTTPNQAPQSQSSSAAATNEKTKDPRIDQVVTLLGEHMPSDASSPMASYLPGFMTLRLMILRPSRTEQENELVGTMLDSYSSYTGGGRSPSDIALLLARDCMFLTQQHQQSIVPHMTISNNSSAISNAPAPNNFPTILQQNKSSNSIVNYSPQLQAAPAPMHANSTVYAAPAPHAAAPHVGPPQGAPMTTQVSGAIHSAPAPQHAQIHAGAPNAWHHSPNLMTSLPNYNQAPTPSPAAVHHAAIGFDHQNKYGGSENHSSAPHSASSGTAGTDHKAMVSE
mmetsp:Transcript_16405/g.24059  ORF Transcript_16405/g.24059 Transcript_16405/m.24059 type:complete len:829 (+) Transcript_16405:112-2598(+)